MEKVIKQTRLSPKQTGFEDPSKSMFEAFFDGLHNVPHHW